jgi:hypothetical protein
MRSVQPSAAAVIAESSNLVALLRELERLREQVRKVELARSLRVDRRKRTRIRRLEQEGGHAAANGFENRRSVFPT